MKKFTVPSLLSMLIMAASLSSCNKPEEHPSEGSLVFGMSPGADSQALKSTLDDSARAEILAVLVTLGNASGELVLNNERLELYHFGEAYVTKEIKLPTGNYKLIKYMVVDDTGTVRFAAPVYDSPMAYLVKQALPIHIEIERDRLTRLNPEVLPVNYDTNPEDFGYISFGIQVVQPLAFYIAAYIDDPRLMAPSVLTDAMLEVRTEPEWAHSFNLEPRINRVVVPRFDGTYVLTVWKPEFHRQVLERSLRELEGSSPERPILVPLKKDHILILKPGPDEGKDATIFRSRPDENFGRHPSFEAASAPPYVIHDHEEASRSLITFDLGGIPEKARIEKAFLSLYYNTPFFYEGIAEAYMDKNLAVFRKVTSAWEEDKVTWNSQPETTDEDQVFLKPMPWISANFYSIDVTEMIRDFRTGPDDLHGILFRLIEEKDVSGFIFGSSDHPEEGMHPVLRLHLVLPEQPADEAGN